VPLDKQFLEFWGNFLINVAKGQKQLEDMAQWIKQGLQGFDELTAMFTRFYGLEPNEKNTPADPDTWESAAKAFRKSFKDYLCLMDAVPQEEHLVLVQKYEKLKAKAASQEETIKHLRMLLNGKTAHGDINKGFQDIIEKQCEQFQKTMDVFGWSLTKDKDPS
jgi:cytochrome c556